MTDSPADPHWVPSAGDDRRLRWLWWVAAGLLAAGVGAFLIRGADRPADPTVESGRTPLSGFGEVSVQVTSADGSVLDQCLLLAANAEQRARGLMTVTDPTLGGYDGMLFRFESDTQSAFWMRNTPMPLSIAYIDSAGSIVSTAEMEPCADVATCPGYPPAGPYRYVVEVPQGRLPAVGIVDGSRLTVGVDTCPPA